MAFEARSTQSTSDYFALRLLDALDTADPASAAFEAQAISRQVGFDFADFNDMVPRALDEVRETEEAYDATHGGGVAKRNHFGDEIADIMFSHINLARHAGLKSSDISLTKIIAGVAASDESVRTITQRIRSRIEAVAANHVPPVESAKSLYDEGMRDAVQLALSQGFEPSILLRENVRKYLKRCNAIEQLAAADGKQWHDLAQEGMIISYWKRAKRLEHTE